MMVKKRMTRLCTFSSIVPLQAGELLHSFVLSNTKLPPAEWITSMDPDPGLS